MDLAEAAPPAFSIIWLFRSISKVSFTTNMRLEWYGDTPTRLLRNCDPVVVVVYIAAAAAAAAMAKSATMTSTMLLLSLCLLLLSNVCTIILTVWYNGYNVHFDNGRDVRIPSAPCWWHGRCAGVRCAHRPTAVSAVTSAATRLHCDDARRWRHCPRDPNAAPPLRWRHQWCALPAAETLLSRSAVSVN